MHYSALWATNIMLDYLNNSLCTVFECGNCIYLGIGSDFWKCWIPEVLDYRVGDNFHRG